MSFLLLKSSITYLKGLCFLILLNKQFGENYGHLNKQFSEGKWPNYIVKREGLYNLIHSWSMCSVNLGLSRMEVC